MWKYLFILEYVHDMIIVLDLVVVMRGLQNILWTNKFHHPEG